MILAMIVEIVYEKELMLNIFQTVFILIFCLRQTLAARSAGWDFYGPRGSATHYHEIDKSVTVSYLW